MNKYGWKVVRRDYMEPHKTLLSVYYRNTPSVYIPGVFTKRSKGCGPLGVFETREAARIFALDRGGKVFKCIYTPSRDTGFWHKNDDMFNSRDNRMTATPRGTLFASAVMLLKRTR